MDGGSKMGFEDKDKDGSIIDDVLEDAGKQFGRFAMGFIGIVENVSVSLMPVIEKMLVAMAESWARRVAEKNT
jgi:hypothetical protein